MSAPVRFGRAAVKPARRAMPRARGQRHVPGVMNKTEARFETDVLIPKRSAGEYVCWWFEGMKLKLGKNCWYTPDFLVLRADGLLEIHEVKGRMMDDAAVKLSVCAAMWPFPISVWRWDRKTGWKEEPWRQNADSP